MTAHDEARPRSAAALVTDRSFGPFFWGLFASNVGTWFHHVAVSVIIFELTASTLAVATVSAIQFGAVLVLGPLSGWLADGVDRRRLLMATLTCSAVGAVVLVAASASGRLSPGVIYAATALVGIGNAGTHPALQAVIPSLVPAADLPTALGLHSVSFNLARAIGPVLGAASLVALGPTASFTLDAASYLVFVAGLVAVPVLSRSAPGPGGRGSFLGGVRVVQADPVVLVGLVAIAAVGWASDPAQTLVPAIAAALDGGERLVGVLMSAFGVGAVAMAVGQGPVIARWGGATAGAVGLALLGSFLLALALGPGAVFTATGFAGCGAGFMLAITGVTTTIHQRVPDATRGRVMALWSMAFLGTRPLTSTVNGFVADNVSLGAGLVVPALAALAAGSVIWRVRHRTPGAAGAPVESVAVPVTPVGKVATAGSEVGAVGVVAHELDLQAGPVRDDGRLALGWRQGGRRPHRAVAGGDEAVVGGGDVEHPPRHVGERP